MAMPALALEADLRSSADARLALQFHHYMQLQREVENRIERKLYRQGKILGGVYVGRGQEAICVGAGLAAQPQDVLFPCHRDMGLYFIRGVHPRQVFAQYMGREAGLTKGRDGNMHMGDMNLRIVAIISAMAASVPVAAGAALALKYRGSKNIAWNFVGDGATSRGDWHEGINFAAVQRLPVVFLINNNQYAYSTPIHKQMACEHIIDRAHGYGIPGEIVDGNDVWAVHRAAERAAAHAREGLGPYMVECKTFRMTGHSAHDSGFYVPEHLWGEWERKDPIARIERDIAQNGWADAAEIAELREAIRRDVDEAIAWAEQCPLPDASTLEHGVYGDR